MKRFSWFCRTALLFAGVALALPIASAQEKGHPVKPLLWKIEGNGLEKPSYLFGTIHISTPAMQSLHPLAEKAFDSAEVLYTEVPFDAKNQMALAPLLIRKDGKTLSDSIGEELTTELDAELQRINPQLNSVPFQQLKTWSVTMALPVLKYQLRGAKAVDQLLSDKAIKAGKEALALETIESQFGILDGFEEDEDIIVLKETLRQIKEDRAAGTDSVDNLIAAYIAGDEKLLSGEIEKSFKQIAESEHKELGERFMKKLFEERNLSMAVTIDEQLRLKPAKVRFFAVGAGHYIGKDNIRDHLAAKGYRITRIQD